jgi:1,4-dihydroxy-2-naphthoate octaprenyltransferase
MSQAYFNWKIVLFALLTTLGLQILSNFANDYGDGVKGTDNEDRVGPKRAIQSGSISPKQMKKAIAFTSFITLLFAVLLIYFALKLSFIFITVSCVRCFSNSFSY